MLDRSGFETELLHFLLGACDIIIMLSTMCKSSVTVTKMEQTGTLSSKS